MTPSRQAPELNPTIEVRTGWVIICKNHPKTGSTFTVTSTFRGYKGQSIKDFISGSGHDWNYWKNKYNFRCVKATQTITIK